MDARWNDPDALAEIDADETVDHEALARDEACDGGAGTDEAQTIDLHTPDYSALEGQLVASVVEHSHLAPTAMRELFEERFAQWSGRRHAVAVSSGTVALMLALRAGGVSASQPVMVSPIGWHQIGHGISLVGASPRLTEIDYWSGCPDPARAARLLTEQGPVAAAVVGNVNGHPADWAAWRALADQQGFLLIEDSTEAIGSVYRGQRVGQFGDVSIFDFSRPSPLCCGEGAMLVTDRDDLASELRYLRARELRDRISVSVGARVPMQVTLGELPCALGVGQLARIDDILAQRQQVASWYREEMQSFEGIKPPYVGEGVELVNWTLYLVHLGKRFTASACAQIVEDMAQQGIETAMYCQPLHQQYHYQTLGYQRGQFPLTERIADRAIVLPLHGGMDQDEVRFVVSTLKDSSVNVGAGAAIY